MLRTLSLHELRALGVESRRVDIHCVTRWSKLDVAFEGVRLAAVLAACGISAANGFVSFVARSSRGHSTSLAMADATNAGGSETPRPPGATGGVHSPAGAADSAAPGRP